jgi:hypothetical protein
VSDPVVCQRGGLCDLTTCDPALGCQITPLPDGASCEDGDPCTSGETCRSGECVRPQTAAVQAATAGGETLVVSRFALKSAGRRGTRLSARGTFATFSTLDPRTNEVRLDVRDAEGYSVYSASVPGSAFVPDRGGTRYLYWIPEGQTPVYNGLQKLLLVMNGDSVDIVAKGLIPPGEDAVVPAALTASAAPKSPKSSSSSAHWSSDVQHEVDPVWLQRRLRGSQ